jgi:hypothetical protein
MAVKVGEFFLEMLVDAASGNLSVRQLIGSLGELDVASATSVGIIGKIADTLWNLTKAAVGTAVEVSALADITGVDPKLAQQWDKAAERVVHHAGSIVKAIQAVHEIQKRIATGEGPPAALTGILGLSPYKIDAQGKAQVKDAMDLMREMAATGSTYRSRSRDVQQNALGQVFGSSGEDMYRVIEQMIAGKFHPEKISVLNDGQVGALNKVDADWIAVKQDVIGIFDKFLLAGNDVDKILSGARALLEDVNHWLDKHKDHSYVADVQNIKKAWKPDTALDLLDMISGRNSALYRLGSANLSRVRVPEKPDLGVGELRGKLDIDLRSNGKPLGTKTTYVDRAGTMRDFWQVTDQLGLSP